MKFFNFKKKKKEGNSEADKVAMLRRIATMTELMKNGYLYLDLQTKRVVISDKLAVLFLGNQEKWEGFLNNLHTWFVYRASQLAWQKVFFDAEVKAVREAKKKFAMLTRFQEKAIREKARMDIDIDKVKLPQIESYDFIISNEIGDGDEPKIIAIGRYEKGKFDMMPYENISL